MQLLQYFMAFLVFLAGFVIIDANVLAGSLGYLLVISAGDGWNFRGGDMVLVPSDYELKILV